MADTCGSRWRPLAAVLLVMATGCSDDPGPVFVDGFESGRLETAKWMRDEKGHCEMEVVRAPVRAGLHALRIEAGKDARCEILPWVGRNILGRLEREPFGEDRWYGFSVHLDSSWHSTRQNEVIAQWHGSRDFFLNEARGRGPPLALRTVRRFWKLTYGSDPDFLSEDKYHASYELWREDYTAGGWTDWVFHVRWSHGDDGLTEVWKDGRLVVSYQGPNTYNDFRGVYMKLGIYHPGVTRVLYLDEFWIDDEKGDGR